MCWMRNQTIFLVAIVITAVAVALAPQGEVAFIKDNEVAVAHDDGSGAKTLTKDKIPKQGLRWSPDGNRFLPLAARWKMCVKLGWLRFSCSITLAPSTN